MANAYPVVMCLQLQLFQTTTLEKESWAKPIPIQTDMWLWVGYITRMGMLLHTVIPIHRATVKPYNEKTRLILYYWEMLLQGKQWGQYLSR